MKYLLLFPPQWTPISPHFALTSLLGQLKGSGFDAHVIDLNIDFFDKVLNKKFIENALNTAISGQDELLKVIGKVYSTQKQLSDYPEKMQNKIIKYHSIKKIISDPNNGIDEVLMYVENARNAIRDKESFYYPEVLVKSVNLLDRALEIASLPHFPSKLSFDNYSNPLFKLNYNSIKYYVFDRDTNMFWDYYESVFDKIEKYNADFIAVSINSSSQIVPGLTLSALLKQKTKAHINIGGNFFGRVTEKILETKEFFEIFADSLSVEEGEGPVIELAKYINGEKNIEDVPNLIYLKDGKVCENPKMKPLKLNDMLPESLDEYDLSKYFAPEIVLPFQSSRGCYWGKCSFCDQDFGQEFNVKNIDKAISEMKMYKEKYGISHYEFIDESVGPKYMEEFSDRLKDEDLKIKYFCDARLESAFSKSILDKAHQTGLQMVMWGVESGSDKIMELINKGIDLNRRFEILKDSSDAGIWNFAFIFFGFPAETKEDALKTIEMLIANKDVIHSYGRSVFSMGKHAKLAAEPEKYGIIEIIPAEFDFSPTIEFKCIGMTPHELHEMLQLCTMECNKAYGNPLWMYLRYREWLFLYLCKYGKDYVSSYKLKFYQE